MLMGVDQRGNVLIKPKTFDKLEQQIRDTCAVVLLTSYGKVLSVCLPGCKTVRKMVGPVLKSDIKW